ncbi:hypothetical protein K470DRAFT_24567 [Piedraia hortae CBS 480.64]|uniref:Uncharacterized protein n=1 Tax=Piedraia hortae CBS 480.64 TaxID=1314780 RepID=A0A6A7C3D5_9PEZI|nr:hypothetical protein K470DRAFT_24567 [Piedraia hortae CBS 480.64]
MSLISTFSMLPANITTTLQILPLSIHNSAWATISFAGSPRTSGGASILSEASVLLTSTTIEGGGFPPIQPTREPSIPISISTTISGEASLPFSAIDTPDVSISTTILSLSSHPAPTVSPTFLPSPVPPKCNLTSPHCPSCAHAYLPLGTTTFEILCDTALVGRTISPQHWFSPLGCVRACEAIEGCLGGMSSGGGSCELIIGGVSREGREGVMGFVRKSDGEAAQEGSATVSATVSGELGTVIPGFIPTGTIIPGFEPGPVLGTPSTFVTATSSSRSGIRHGPLLPASSPTQPPSSKKSSSGTPNLQHPASPSSNRTSTKTQPPSSKRPSTL